MNLQFFAFIMLPVNNSEKIGNPGEFAIFGFTFLSPLLTYTGAIVIGHSELSVFAVREPALLLGGWLQKIFLRTTNYLNHPSFYGSTQNHQ